MRTTIKLISANTVQLLAIDPATDEQITREFWIPCSGGYVREGDSQVCELLAHRGNTLQASDGEGLLKLIRTEWRRYRESEKRELRRWI